MPDPPITPHAVPRLDADGRLTYIGEDGRRYVVASAPEPAGGPEGEGEGDSPRRGAGRS